MSRRIEAVLEINKILEHVPQVIETRNAYNLRLRYEKSRGLALAEAVRKKDPRAELIENLLFEEVPFGLRAIYSLPKRLEPLLEPYSRGEIKDISPIDKELLECALIREYEAKRQMEQLLPTTAPIEDPLPVPGEPLFGN